MSKHPKAAAADAAATPPADAAPAPAQENAGLLPETYNLADYRWVPVRRVSRLDGWTEEKMRRFIETLADTGQVSLAAKAVGLSRESAYKLRRSAHGAAFARAWDAARHHAGGFLEDVAFERVLEGVEHNAFDECGNVICTKRVVSDRLLMFLLRHLKPERYAADALKQPAPPPAPVEATLREMEPRLPAPPAELFSEEELGAALQLAEIADDKLPHFLTEQRPPKSPEREAAEAHAAQQKRGKAAWEKSQRKEELSDAEFGDMCRFIEPNEDPRPRSRKRYR